MRTAWLRVFRSVWSLGAILWAGALLAGFSYMSYHASKGGTDRVAPDQWPVQSSLSRCLTKPTLVLFVHPYCPCSNAILEELQEIQQETGTHRGKTYIVFSDPSDDSGWVSASPYWRKALKIPGVEMVRDIRGLESKLFAAETSGRAVLYGIDGTRVFQGGITIGRGVSGDNPGKSSVVALIQGTVPEVSNFVAFGCPLNRGESK